MSLSNSDMELKIQKTFSSSSGFLSRFHNQRTDSRIVKMVVRGLQTYVEKNIPEALYSGNLGELINTEKSKGKVPTIVLDESATKLFQLFQANGAMQPRIWRNNIENFVNSIISCGADLVVFLRGNVRNIEKWYYKEKCNYTDQENALENFRNGITNDDPIAEIEKYHSSFCNFNSFHSISRNHYKVFTSIKNVHIEVAEFATKNNCLAVIGQDSNYFIYEGIRFYIYVKDFDVKTLNCTIFDRQKLIQHFKLKSYHLPLFASLCGNDVVSVRLPQKKFLTYPNEFIAKTVRSTTKDPYKHAKEIAHLINHPEVDENLIIKSLDMYLNFSNNFTNNEKHAFANERKRLGEWSNTLYTVFTEKQFRNNHLTGLGPNMFPVALLLRPLRKIIYGVLFFKSGINPVVEEYLLEEMQKQGKFSIIPSYTSIGTVPASEHPGLTQLWDESTPNLSSIKWELFCSSISKTLESSTIKEIPPKLLIPVLSLHYLVTVLPNCGKSVLDENFEIETFLLVALFVSSDSYDPLEIQNLKVSGEQDLRLLYLKFVFIETCYTLSLLNEACGLVVPKALSCICNFYDSILFNFVYYKMKKGAKWVEFLNGNAHLEIVFSRFMKIIHEGV